jgi:hypothetical protein
MAGISWGSLVGSITDEPAVGTVSRSRSITDVADDVYEYGSHGWVQQQFPTLSPPDQADIIADTPEPDEELDEYMDRHGDE